MRVILYCQYVWGMGHLFRSLEIARALAGHEVTLVAGGREVDLPLPEHVRLARLPALSMDEEFTTLTAASPGQDVAEVKRRRREALFGLLEEVRPAVFVIELYPFGRSVFGFELDPVLAAARAGRFGRVLTACSVRDVLVEKKDPQAYEARVVETLNRHFDLVLVHSDARVLPLSETFGRMGDIRIPVRYTGFVAARHDPARARALRAELGVAPRERLIVASAGGGRSGFPLHRAVLGACRRLAERLPLRLELFTGPFMEEGQFRELQAQAAPGLRVSRFTPRFLDYLGAADLSISLAGYNTCMNLLTTGVPALVLPYARQREQPLRVERFAPYAPLSVLTEEDLDGERLCRAIERGLGLGRGRGRPALDLDGAGRTARILTTWPAVGEPGAPCGGGGLT
jgi:predicted glycosyltransferase